MTDVHGCQASAEWKAAKWAGQSTTDSRVRDTVLRRPPHLRRQPRKVIMSRRVCETTYVIDEVSSVGFGSAAIR